MKYETGLYPSVSCPHVSTPCFQTHKSWLNPPSTYNNLGKNVAIMRFTILYQISHIQATFSHSEPEGVNSGQVVPNNLERVVHPRWRNNLGPVGDDWDPQWKPKYVPWCLRVNICVRVEFGYQKGIEWLRIWPNLKYDCVVSTALHTQAMGTYSHWSCLVHHTTAGPKTIQNTSHPRISTGMVWLA